MPDKHHQERREALRTLLSSGPATTQRALVAALQAKGFTATQSSVSRDLKELGAIKTRHGYELESPSGVDTDLMAAMGELIRGVHPAGPNLLVIKTGVGAAQRVALALDRSSWPEIVGNIGGDDTVFVATSSAQAQRRLSQRLTRSTREHSREATF